jgi:peptidoglycan/xylan/chitin deacetylase (PgdA/CDA1 family)
MMRKGSIAVQLATPTIKLTLDLISHLRLDRLAGRFVPKRGVIFALHRVLPASKRAFNPNGLLEVTPEFLDATITTVRAAGYRIMPLEDAVARIGTATSEPFACFTFDDAYRDTRVYAYPVLKARGVPFTIFVPERFADGQGQLWWVELEMALRQMRDVPARLTGLPHDLPCRTDAEKSKAFDRIYRHLRDIDETSARTITRELCARAGVCVDNLCRDLIMPWDELRALAVDPLVSFGAHTSNHYALAKLPRPQAAVEMLQSKHRIERELQRRCEHFCYPYAGQRGRVLVSGYDAQGSGSGPP